MDAASIVTDTQRARFCPQTDRRTDGLCETSAPRLNFVECVCGGGGGGGGGGVGWGWGVGGGVLFVIMDIQTSMMDIHN